MTSERLSAERIRHMKALSERGGVPSLSELTQAFDELLSLRTDAGDEEVRQLEEDCFNGAEHGAVSSAAVRDLAFLAIARGRTRTDAVNKAAEWAKECEGLQEQLRSAREEIERLKAERDNHERQHLHYRKLWDDANSKIEDLRTGVTQ